MNLTGAAFWFGLWAGRSITPPAALRAKASFSRFVRLSAVSSYSNCASGAPRQLITELFDAHHLFVQTLTNLQNIVNRKLPWKLLPAGRSDVPCRHR